MFTLATDAAPGRPNEDFVVATTDLAIVVDGAGIPHGGCLHGVAWYSRHLATLTLAALTERPESGRAAYRLARAPARPGRTRSSADGYPQPPRWMVGRSHRP